MKTLYHVNGPSRNYGDQAIVKVMQTELMKQINEPTEFINLDVKLPNPITRETIELINDTGDMLIVGGGGMVMAGDGHSTRSGWQFNVNIEDLKKLRVPLVIYSIGYNVFPNENELDDPDTISHLIETQKLSSLFSVRDKGSKEKLRSLGLVDMPVTPDPAMFCPYTDVTLPGISDSDLLIGLNFAGDRTEKRFSKETEYEVIVRLSEILESLVFKTNGKIVYIPHVSKYDLEASKHFRECLGEYFYDISEHLPFMYPESICNVPILAGIYRKMSLVIGMRGHSNIIPYGQGVPVIGFGSHNKTGYFSREIDGMSIGNHCRGLKQHAEYVLQNPNNRSIIEESLRKFRFTFNLYNSAVVSIL